ncbi:arginine biosynthesis bifunctional protein ArgJ [Spirochaetia bacterium]|nr:arginine biosynthesis bifunctional protein ArgJ [Spirochaetia bacterium]
MKDIRGGVCAPKGFKAGGVWCGIKKSSQKRDLAIIYSEKPCTSAAMFTTNIVQAASVIVSREHLAGSIARGGGIQAVIANSGNANACTGEAGLSAARRMAALTAQSLSIEPDNVAVASTGVIGAPLPLPVIEEGIKPLAAALTADEAGHSAALEAIMTTDTRKKDGALQISLDGVPVSLGGMVKGSGMIHPNMATMLGFITTDAAISRELLDKALRRAVHLSFNRITIDGDTSTNDTILIMANGEAGNSPITSENDAYREFSAALENLCIALARKMAADGEGASRLLTVNVSGAAEERSAEILAKSVASSSLVKAAIFGADANWGRVLCALGYAGIPFDPSGVDVSFASAEGSVGVCRAGEAIPFSEEDAKRILLKEEIEIIIKLYDTKSYDTGSGKAIGAGSASVWGCDLTYDYVKINGDYRS